MKTVTNLLNLVVGLLATFIFTVQAINNASQQKPIEILVTIIRGIFDAWLVIISIVILLLALNIFISIRTKRKENKKWSQIGEKYNVIHKAQNQMIAYIVRIRDENIHSQEFDIELYKNISSYFSILTRGISEIFEIYTGHKCSVSIKTFDTETETIKTEFRDPGQSIERKESDGEDSQRAYSYKNNTAFRVILDNPRENHYASNNLKLKSLLKCRRRENDCIEYAPCYENGNPNWAQWYRRTMVVPAGVNILSSDIDKNSIYGFICVDSLKANLRDTILLNMLRQFAFLYYAVATNLPSDQVDRVLKR